MKIVLAYSGGLDTSVLLSWIKETYGAEMIAFCADIGQEEELRGLDKKALRTGASKCYIDDLTEEFARDFIFPIDHLLRYITAAMTLFPGDLILTGTPAGGAPMQPGDQVAVSVEGLGILTNPVVG